MKLVHCKKEPYTVYIGRPGFLGNPFEIGRDGNREEVIRKYEEWLRRDDPNNLCVLDRIFDLKDEDILGCWCSPKSCHGDVIIKLWKEMHEQKS